MRRRAASHNVKRVPKALREKAKREMKADGTKPSKKIRGKQRLKGKHTSAPPKQVSENVSAEDKIEENDDPKVPRLKPRSVTSGKFAHRQGDHFIYQS
jgi:Ribonucleases P/MRP protein subunit POP1